MRTHKHREAPHPASKRVRFVNKRAALWYFRIMDEPAMDLSDRSRFLIWLRRSPDNVAEFLWFLQIHGCLDETKLRAAESSESGATELEAALNTLPSNAHPADVEPLDAERRRSISRSINSTTGQLWKFAALIAGIAVLLTFAIREPRIDDMVSTAAGQHQHIELPDGSVTHVGARSQLRIVFNGEQRVVHLYQGEAVFDVEKDPARPFTVITHLIDVTAVGTKFGVAKDIGVVATVSQGVVKITAHDNPDMAEVTLLRAGQQLRVSDNSLTQSQVAHLDATRALQWADGSLGFEADQTIGEAVQEFNRHNVAQIEIEQPAIAAIELEGPYRYSVHASAMFARDVAANNGLVLREDRTGEVTRLRLVERRTK